MQITGTDAGETLSGTAENDVIQGLGGADRIDGKAGDDVIDGGAGSDTLEGGAGDDTLNGGDDADYVQDVTSGSDTLRGGAGGDYITLYHSMGGASETTVIDAGAGDDNVAFTNYNSGSATIDLGDGADRLNLGAVVGGGVAVTLGAGSDTVVLQRYANVAGALRFADFATGAGGDVFDLGGYLSSALSNWDGSNPFGPSGYLKLVQSGAATLLQIDRDGAGGTMSGFTTLATFDNSAAAAFTAANLGGYGPDGAVPEGRTITGTAQSDLLPGTVGADVISGLGGYDSIDGKAGDDRIDGGADGDFIEGGLGDDTVDGGDGDDTLSDNGGGSDTLRGGAGADTISVYHYGGGAPETIRIEGGAGADNVTLAAGGSGAATIDLGDDADKLTLGSTPNMTVAATLGGGQDTVTLQSYASFKSALVLNDFAAGDAGDVLDLSGYLGGALSGWDGSNPFGPGGYLKLVQSGADTVLRLDRDGGAGTSFGPIDLVLFRGVDAATLTAANLGGYAPDGSPVLGKVLTGTADGDTLTGTAGADTISGLGGGDTIDGRGGNDAIDGGAGADTIQGGLGDDVIDGGDGDDFISDAGGSDTVRGGAGNDVISIGHYSSGPTPVTETIRIEGGAGDDQVSYYGYTLGSAAIDLGDGADRIALGNGFNAVRVALGAGRDTVALSPFASQNAPVFTDFAGGAAGDAFELGSSFTANLTNWDGSNPFGPSGHLRLVQSGANVLFQVDRDGAAGNNFAFQTLAVLENTDGAQLTAANFGGYAPRLVNGADLATAFVTAPATVAEGDAPFRLALTLKNAASVYTNVTMSFLADQSTATNGTDVDVGGFSGAFQFTQSPAGDYRIDLGSVSVIDDALAEGLETIAIKVTASGQVFETGTDSIVVKVQLRSDDVVGTDAGEVLNGTVGADRLVGLGGNDTLYGGAGDDRLFGGRGGDTLYGGAGADRFYFDPLAKGERDVIKDFGKTDRLLSTVKLFDSDGDGVIGFGGDKALNIGAGDIRIYSEANKLMQFVVYQGETVENGVTYYSYGTTHG